MGGFGLKNENRTVALRMAIDADRPTSETIQSEGDPAQKSNPIATVYGRVVEKVREVLAFKQDELDKRRNTCKKQIAEEEEKKKLDE